MLSAKAAQFSSWLTKTRKRPAEVPPDSDKCYFECREPAGLCNTALRDSSRHDWLSRKGNDRQAPFPELDGLGGFVQWTVGSVSG